jgi:hypothetical protein
MCEPVSVATHAVEIRQAEDADRRPMALLFAAVAEERDGIAAEPPVDAHPIGETCSSARALPSRLRERGRLDAACTRPQRLPP